MTTAAPLSSLDPDRLAPDASNPEVSRLMRPEVVFCLPSTNIDAVAKLMADNDLGEVAVIIDRRPVGFVEAGDILDRLATGDVVIRGSDFAVRPPVTEVQARDLLRSPLVLVDEHQRIGEVVSLMRRRGRSLALVMHEDETPVGMVTPRELAAFLAAAHTAGSTMAGAGHG
ncbi:MAG: cyclic nucleotide-binding/CBS domain-containing protein [Candidatus Dormibacteria bacterium]